MLFIKHSPRGGIRAHHATRLILYSGRIHEDKPPNHGLIFNRRHRQNILLIISQLHPSTYMLILIVCACRYRASSKKICGCRYTQAHRVRLIFEDILVRTCSSPFHVLSSPFLSLPRPRRNACAGSHSSLPSLCASMLIARIIQPRLLSSSTGVEFRMPTLRALSSIFLFSFWNLNIFSRPTVGLDLTESTLRSSSIRGYHYTTGATVSR